MTSELAGRGSVSRLFVWCLETLEPSEEAALASALDRRIELTVGEAPPDPPGHTWIVSGRPTVEALQASPDLRGLVVPFAGVPKPVRELLRGRPEIAVHNLHHNAAATAELALALLLAAAKRILPADRALRAGDWTPRFESEGPMLLDGRRLVVYGHGAIGKRIGRACRALGMEVHAIRRGGAARDGGTGEEGVVLHARHELHACLALADVLVVTVPLTPETEGSIGARELALVPRGALLVNVSRGAVVDEEALFEALRTGHLGAAGLDVWYRYPDSESARTSTPPSRFPFGELGNVVMSPHRGGNMDRGAAIWSTELARLLNAAARGEPVPNRVDLDLGY